MTPFSRHPVGPRSPQNRSPLLVAAVSLLALSSCAGAQSDSGSTPTNLSCTSLTSLTDFQFSVVEAYMEPVSEDAPEHLEWLRRIIDATDPDLRRFREHGGKMLMFFGWADSLNPLQGVRYYEAVLDEMGSSTTDFFRLFMIPGMFHCDGGVGMNRLEHEGQRYRDYTRYLQAWVEEDWLTRFA